MGLDMYLSAKRYISGSEYCPEDKATYEALWPAIVGLPGVTLPYQHDHASKSIELELPVMYWRKANHIHQWFVDNVQDGKDECQTAYVDIDKLRELDKLCAEVITSMSPAVAAERLPCSSGFFFGGTDYDEYYFEQVRSTMECTSKLIEQYDADGLKGWDLYYHSSW